MTEEILYQALNKLEDVECFLRGVSMDPRIPLDTKEAIVNKYGDISLFLDDAGGDGE